MEHYLEMTGKNEEAAIAAALAKLGLERDDVSVEILERAKSGFLGIGNSPAKVRVTYEGPDEPAPEPAPKAAPVRESRPAPARESRPAPARESRPAPVERPAKEAPPPRAESRPRPPRRSGEDPAPFDAETAKEIETFLAGLLQHMELTATPTVSFSERGVYEVMIDGEQLGALIGRRGETLDAIQQLTGYAVNRGRSRRVRIHVDAEGYRQKREQALEALALKVAEKVLKYRKDMPLEPMNAYERHIVHTALQEVDGITTHSVGSEPARRVVISCQK